MNRSIIFAISSLEGGGAERVIANLANHFTENEFHVTIVLTYSKIAKVNYILSPKVKIVYAANASKLNSIPLYSKVNRIFFLRNLVLKIKPDSIISFTTDVNIACLVSTIGIKTKVIISERIFPPLHKLPKYLDILRKLFYPLADNIIMQTSDGVRWAKFNFPAVNISKIENPIYIHNNLIDLQRSKELVYQREKIILVVGRLERQKRVDIAIQIFSKIHNQFPSFKLVIIGKGSEEYNLKKLCSDLGLTNKIFFEGFTDFPEYWYQKATLLLVTSEYEGFPNVILESMHYGVPVISNNCKTGPSDIIRNGFNGFLVDENDIEIFTERIRFILNNRKKTEIIVRNAFNSLNRFEINNIINKWIKVIYKT